MKKKQDLAHPSDKNITCSAVEKQLKEMFKMELKKKELELTVEHSNIGYYACVFRKSSSNYYHQVAANTNINVLVSEVSTMIEEA